MTYYAVGNVVYAEDQKVVFVVSPVWGLLGVAKFAASTIAQELNDADADSSDVLRGSLD